MASINRENFLRALYVHHDGADEPSYAQQEFIRAYAIGTSDQWEGDSIDSIREQMSKPLDQIHVNDSEENRAEFNRRFNYIINYHANLWHNDNTPFKDRNRAFYAYRYFRLFDDIMRLLEKFPDAGSNKNYWSIVHTVQRYKKIYYERR